MEQSPEHPMLSEHWLVWANLFLASFLALYFELLIIRYLSTEIRSFAYLKNLPLMASFLGIGLGMILGRPRQRLLRAFPWVAAALFLLIRYAQPLYLTHIGVRTSDYFVWGNIPKVDWAPFLLIPLYLITVVAVLSLIVAFFVVLGGMVGEYLKNLRPLQGYGCNLAGSLAGVAAFTGLSFLNAPPVWWLIIGLSLSIPFFYKDKLALGVFLVIVLATGLPNQNTFWSPYYRIDLFHYPAPVAGAPPSRYLLAVNHDYHQKIVDLSPQFMADNPAQEPNRSALPTYELPYRLVPNPRNVLIIGAGSGNDAAAALRHGAAHVDAVEIDPVIVEIGQQYHPEHPYSSPRVSVHINDARAFLKTSHDQYDLIVFGYLDAHTLISGYSSLRLDNYVYTLQSFQEAKKLLGDHGSLIVAFAGGRSFVSDRMYATLQKAFGVAPVAYWTGYDTAGVVFVEGPAQSHELQDLPRFSPDPKKLESTIVATDSWPFLYLAGRTVPTSILLGLVVFLLGVRMLLLNTGALAWRSHREYFHFLLLGVGFLLLETKGVTDLALLFGSTWIVNAIVIGAFLTMALAANALAIFRPISRKRSFALLFFVLGIGMVLPYSFLNGASLPVKILAAGFLVGLPVFFSGLVFSDCFRSVTRPSEALGVNLFGAVVGGMLENLVMIGGTAVLGVLAILLYGSAAWFIGRSRLSTQKETRDRPAQEIPAQAVP